MVRSPMSDVAESEEGGGEYGAAEEGPSSLLLRCHRSSVIAHSASEHHPRCREADWLGVGDLLSVSGAIDSTPELPD